MQLTDQTASHDPKTEKFPWKLGLILYSLSYLPMMLFSKAYFWDDWFTHRLQEADFRKHLVVGGNWPLRAIIEVDLLGLNPMFFHAATFVCFLVGGWLLFRILTCFEFLNLNQRSLVTILFLILPINSARVAMINFHYSLSLLIFYFAWYLLVTKKSITWRLLSIPLFLISFDTVALIVFFVVPCCHLGYLMYLDQKIKKIYVALISATLLLLAPLYYIVDHQINPPQGGYATMYTPQKLGILRALLLLLICAAVGVWLLWKHRTNLGSAKRQLLIVLGITVTFVGATPYIIGGHLVDTSAWILNFVPTASDWNSRHQLLLGLGLSLLICGVIGDLDSRFKRQSLKVLFGFCVVWNLTYMQGYYLDSIKQNEVISAIRQSNDFDDSKIIMVNDLADRFNGRGRGIRSYEFDGMFDFAKGASDVKTITGYSYVKCNDEFVPDTLMTITARNGRLESTITGKVGIEILVESIRPCG